MSFSKIKDKVLVACGRCCSICHSFSGLKMELHHIILKSEGGDDSYDNCIPLCFDCHADMTSYDHKHPKGIKYTSNELKLHRDNWYDKVKNNTGVSNEKFAEKDLETLKIIIKILPPKGNISYLRGYDFGDVYKVEMLEQLDSLVIIFKTQPWIEFYDTDLESKKGELLKSITTFLSTLRRSTFTFGDELKVSKISRDWDKEQREEAVEKIHNALDIMIEKYDHFMRDCRLKLKIPIE